MFDFNRNQGRQVTQTEESDKRLNRFTSDKMSHIILICRGYDIGP